MVYSVIYATKASKKDDSMNIKWRTEPEKLLDDVELGRVQNTVKRLKLEAGTAIDSYTMSPNGPKLNSIFLIGEGVISETRMSGKYMEFDVGSLRSLHNYRVTYGEHPISTDEAVLATASVSMDTTDAEAKPASALKYITVTLMHTDSISSKLSFFGEDAESWLSFLMEAFPPTSGF